MDLKVNQKTRNLVILGVLLAIGIILDITPLGAIPMPGGVSATITMVPVIIGGIILGPLPGLYLGIGMGVVSLLHALMRPVTPLDPLFVNPLLSVLPRAMIGVVSGNVYRISKKLLKNSSLSLVAGGIAGSLTNTVLVLLMMYLLFAPKIQEILELTDSKALRIMIYGIVSTNGLMEAVVAAVITCGIGLALQKGLPKGFTRL
ncbi:ECF transporter S component [Clostridiales bacterium COT073_COT-073]|nr:ECF transporter S component [Clostridiales bacterium COT073_COT-073]